MKAKNDFKNSSQLDIPQLGERLMNRFCIQSVGKDFARIGDFE
jgi:hypothetical protein